jgi:hypothetical protein
MREMHCICYDDPIRRAHGHERSLMSHVYRIRQVDGHSEQLEFTRLSLWMSVQTHFPMNLPLLLDIRDSEYIGDLAKILNNFPNPNINRSNSIV